MTTTSRRRTRVAAIQLPVFPGAWRVAIRLRLTYLEEDGQSYEASGHTSAWRTLWHRPLSTALRRQYENATARRLGDALSASMSARVSQPCVPVRKTTSFPSPANAVPPRYRSSNRVRNGVCASATSGRHRGDNER
jgi:hypothetical protein